MLSGSSLRDWIFCTTIGFGSFVLGVTLPVLTLPLMLVYPFPALFLAYSAGLRSAATSIICSSLLLSIFFTSLQVSPFLSVVYLVMFGLSGLLIGILARKIDQAGDLLLVAILISLSCKLIVTLVAFRITGHNLLTPDAAQMESAVLAFFDSRFSMLSGGERSLLKENVSQTVQYLIMLIPYTVILFSATEVLVSCSLASFLAGRRGGKRFFRLPPLGQWSFPKNILLALVVGFICEMLASKDAELALVGQLGVNLSAIARTLFIIQGLAVSYCFMERRGFPKVARVAMIIATPIITILGDILSIVGIVDIGFNFRERFKGE